MKFIHLTDTHLVAPGRELHGLDPARRLETCAARIAARHADAAFCVLTGDFAEALKIAVQAACDIAGIDSKPIFDFFNRAASQLTKILKSPGKFINNLMTAVGMGIRKQSGANTVAVVDAVYERLERLRPQFPPGIDYGSGMDFTKPIREAVDETLFALTLGALLATLTVLVFLRRWRPTLIVGVAIPISLITTFGVMWMLDYTLNTMTLLAMALAVGVVIDDAIVVLENIERHREEGAGAREAASRGTAEIEYVSAAEADVVMQLAVEDDSIWVVGDGRTAIAARWVESA